jgi:hypothetical protein
MIFGRFIETAAPATMSAPAPAGAVQAAPAAVSRAQTPIK